MTTTPMSEREKLADECDNIASFSATEMPLYLAQDALKRASAALRTSPPDQSRDTCAKCGCETKGEAALVGGQIWCHPCADQSRDGELKPCPFCGRKVALSVLEDEPGEILSAWVHCDCGVETPDCCVT